MDTNPNNERTGKKMAVKQDKSKAETAPVADVAIQAGSEGNGEAPAPKRRGRAKGQPAGPRLIWTLERDQALAAVLQRGWTKQESGAWTQNPDHDGSIKTAKSVAEALASHPAFANAEAPVTPERVKAHLDSEIKSRENPKAPNLPRPVHGWMRLSVNRSRLNSEVFD